MGEAVLLLRSIEFGRTVYYTVMTMGKITEYAFEEVKNMPRAIIAGIAFLIISIIIWRMICEIIFIIIRCLVCNTSKTE